MFVRKGCVYILIPVLTFIFNLSLPQEVSLHSEKPDDVPAFKKGNSVSTNNYSPVSILNTLSKNLDFSSVNMFHTI